MLGALLAGGASVAPAAAGAGTALSVAVENSRVEAVESLLAAMQYRDLTPADLALLRRLQDEAASLQAELHDEREAAAAAGVAAGGPAPAADAAEAKRIAEAEAKEGAAEEMMAKAKAMLAAAEKAEAEAKARAEAEETAKREAFRKAQAEAANPGKDGDS